MISFVSLLLAALPAFARQPVTCSYNIHTVQNAEIRYDHYYENPLEMSELAKGRSHGTETFADGSSLTVDSAELAGTIVIRARFRQADRILSELKGASPFVKPHVYRLSRTKDVSDSSTDLQFANFEIRCLVK